MKIAITIIFWLGISTNVLAGNINNADVKRFANNADLCEHFLGEIGDTNSRQEQKRIIASANKYCDKAKKQYKLITKKYQDDTEVMQLALEYRDLLSEDYTQ